jgi:hypothetical protein
MPAAKFAKSFDYRKGNGAMTSYPADFSGDIPQAHYDAAAKAGALADAPAKAAAPAGGDKGTK